MHKKWHTTLRIFFGFVALAGTLDLYANLPGVWGGDSVDGLSILFIALDMTYILGGFYLYFNIQKLLPEYREQLVFGITGIFLTEVLFTLASLPSTIAHPENIDPSLTGQDAWWFVLGSVVGIGFTYLVYSVIVANINQLAGINRNHNPGRTLIYWGIVAIFVLYIAALILSENAAVW